MVESVERHGEAADDQQQRDGRDREQRDRRVQRHRHGRAARTSRAGRLKSPNTMRTARNTRYVKMTGVPRGRTNVRIAASSTNTAVSSPTSEQQRLSADDSSCARSVAHATSVVRVRRAAAVTLALSLPLLLLDARFAPTSASGRVATRGRSMCSAAAILRRSRSSASSRFWACERRSEAVGTHDRSELSRAAAPAGAGRATAECSMSKRSSTRVFDVLACWPPGPPEPVNRHSSSSSRNPTRSLRAERLQGRAHCARC